MIFFYCLCYTFLYPESVAVEFADVNKVWVLEVLDWVDVGGPQERAGERQSRRERVAERKQHAEEKCAATSSSASLHRRRSVLPTATDRIFAVAVA